MAPDGLGKIQHGLLKHLSSSGDPLCKSRAVASGADPGIDAELTHFGCLRATEI